MIKQRNDDEEIKLEPWREPTFFERPMTKFTIGIFKLLVFVPALSAIVYFIGRSLM